ncbi:ribonuclease H-like domain-containing protein [Mycena leptocephala]|nr:ribonuclease H-like domain-containing protein [Mycena leptocephala]
MSSWRFAGLELTQNGGRQEIDEFSELPKLVVPDDVTSQLCYGASEIDVACTSILSLINENENDNVVVDVGFDMEWEFTTGIGASGPQRTALIQIAVDKTVHLFYVYTLKKLPGSLITLLRSRQFLKVGWNIAADFQKLAWDFPDSGVPVKKDKKIAGILDIGQLAARKNTVPKASASLESIVAATLGLSPPKDLRISSWGTPKYSDAQRDYAVLDAYVLLLLLKQLRTLNTDGQPLSAVTPLGQLVSLYVRNHEIARGAIIEQPAYSEILGGAKKIGVSITKTRALIRVDQVLAPGCLIPHHKTTIAEVQNGRESFEMVVSISSLRTRNSTSSTIPCTTESERTAGTIELIPPPKCAHILLGSSNTDVNNQSNIASESDSEGSENDVDEQYPRYH